MATATEQRKTPRYEVHAVADLTGSEVYLNHKLVNISLGGLAFQCDHAEEIGAEIDLLVHFPELGSSLPLRGQVVWANRSHPADMGIRFIGLDDKKRDTLKQYLQKALAHASQSQPSV